MDRMESTLKMLAQIMDLGMAIMTRSDTIGCPGFHNLVKF